MLTNSSFREKSRCASGLLEGCLRLPRGSGPCAAAAAAAQKALMEKSAYTQARFRDQESVCNAALQRPIMEHLSIYPCRSTSGLRKSRTQGNSATSCGRVLPHSGHSEAHRHHRIIPKR